MGSSKSKPVEIDDEEAIKVKKDIDVNAISEMSRIDILQINSLKAIVNKLERVNECKKDKIYYKLPALNLWSYSLFSINNINRN